AGGIILTASHNPVEWNALKFVGPDGIFLDGIAGTRVRELAAGESLPRAGYKAIGGVEADADAIARHLAAVLALRAVDLRKIRRRRFRVALDTVRGAGGVVMPNLLERLGCRVTAINLETDGLFPRPPEPVPENLKALGALVRRKQADIGIAVDPDVDRLAIVDEKGRAAGEGGEEWWRERGGRAAVCNRQGKLGTRKAECGTGNGRRLCGAARTISRSERRHAGRSAARLARPVAARTAVGDRADHPVDRG